MKGIAACRPKCAANWKLRGSSSGRHKDLTAADKAHLSELVPARNLSGAHAAGHRSGHPFPHLLNKSLNWRP